MQYDNMKQACRHRGVYACHTIMLRIGWQWGGGGVRHIHTMVITRPARHRCVNMCVGVLVIGVDVILGEVPLS